MNDIFSWFGEKWDKLIADPPTIICVGFLTIFLGSGLLFIFGALAMLWVPIMLYIVGATIMGFGITVSCRKAAALEAAIAARRKQEADREAKRRAATT